MPVYTYKPDGCSKTVDLFMSVGEMVGRQDPKGYVTLDDGRRARRVYDFKAAHPGNWPQKSLAVGCHPDQVKDYRKECDRRGVPTEVTDAGEVVFRSPRHKARFCNAFHYEDWNGSRSGMV